MVLELAGLAKRIVIRVEGRSPQLDGSSQDVADRGVDGTYLLLAQSVGLARWMYARGEEYLVHVDVA
jgi:hypothetical protein